MIQQSDSELRGMRPPKILLKQMTMDESVHQPKSNDLYPLNNDTDHSFDSVSRLSIIDQSFESQPSANSSANGSPDTLQGTDLTDSPVSPLTAHSKYYRTEMDNEILSQHSKDLLYGLNDPSSALNPPQVTISHPNNNSMDLEPPRPLTDESSAYNRRRNGRINGRNVSRGGDHNGTPNGDHRGTKNGTQKGDHTGDHTGDDTHAGDHNGTLEPPSDTNRLHIQKSSIASLSSASRRAAVTAAELNDDVLVGTRVSEGHENFVTAYNMLTGIRVAVSRCTAKNNRALTPDDFTVTEELSFDLYGGGGRPSSKYMFRFKDYMPWVFRHLRDAFKLDPADYLMSLTSKYIVSELGSPGKSGSFFYYSRDYRFIIKTIHKGEHKLLRKILRQYYGHIMNNPDTLISQFYGLHRVRLPFGKKIHFVVMNNVFPALYEIHERFDLKGSLHGRMLKPDPTKPIAVYKDLDWLRKHRRIVLGPEKREKLIKQLEIDVQFLEKVNVMDYSLLIGIHDMRKGNAALNSLLNLAEFGPQDDAASQTENRVANAAVQGKQQNRSARLAQEDFRELQDMLQRATPERLKEFDFADEYRSEFYFYKDHGGFMSTNDEDDDREVIYYLGIIDFLTGYGVRKSLESFFKGLVTDRKDLSAVPAREYGERFLKFLRGSIGPKISDSKADADN